MAIAAACGAALVVASRNAPPFREVSDGAILEIYTLQALKGTLLLGPYSRFDWHHPGPLFFYLEAPWYWASGYHTAGMQAGALAINAGATALAAWALASTAPSSSAVVAILAAIAFFAVRAGDLIVSAWNPHVIVFPLIAYVVVAACFAASGRRSLLVWLAIVGSFLVQTHVAAAPVVGVLGFVVCGARREALVRRWRSTAVVALALWMPPLVEQLTRHPGNLRAIASFFLSGGSGQTLTTAIDAWASSLMSPFATRFEIAMGSELAEGSLAAVVSATIVVAALIVVAMWAKNAPLLRWLASSSAISTLVALLAATRIHERIIDHEVFWMSALGVIAAGTIAAAAITMIGRSRQASRVSIAAALALTGVAIIGSGANGIRHTLERTRTVDDHSVDVLAEQFDRYFQSSGAHRPLVRIEPQVWPIAAGALLLTVKANRQFAVDGRWSTMFGEAFAANGPSGSSIDGEVAIGGSVLQPVLTAIR